MKVVKYAGPFGLVLPALTFAACLATDPGPDGNGPAADSIIFSTVETGAAHACGLDVDGQAYCWGENGVGQLGLGDVDSRFEPWAVLQGSLVFMTIAAGATHTCATVQHGDVYCWGGNEYGQLGRGEVSTIVASPAKVFGDVEFTSVSPGGVHSCGLSAAGLAYCWGAVNDGQLGRGFSDAIPRPSPDTVIGGYHFTEISSGNNHTCAITSGGDAFCWGNGTFGQLGQGENSSSDEPVMVTGGTKFFHISAGDEHTCGLAFDGEAYCWGEGSDGRLGNGGITDSNVPVPVSGGLLFESISTGGAHTCALAGTRRAYCWGRNDSGQLGDGTNTTQPEPVAVAGSVEFETVSAGTGPIATATCGFSTTGFIYCWGSGGGGMVGNGSSISARVPTLVSGQLGAD